MGSFGLGVTSFYLNFLYRALGFDGLALGALVGAQALGVAGGVGAARYVAPGRSRRLVIIGGGAIVGVGIAGILTQSAFALLAVAAALVGMGGIIASSSGLALLADATEARARSSRFGQQIALGTMAAFAASVIAGALAQPVAAYFGARESDALTLRALVALGGIAGAASAIPILFIRDVAVPRGGVQHAGRLLRRFIAIEFVFGLGAGAFVPFTNLFFADRFHLAFGAIGFALGTIAVGGSGGALLHGRLVASRLGQVRGVVAVELASIPFALAAVFSGEVIVAVLLLAARAALMYGAQATWSAYTLSSFAPAERAAVNATLALAWSIAAAISASVSGAIRGAMGPDGFTINVLTLALCYAAGASLVFTLFRGRHPQGDTADGPRAIAREYSHAPDPRA
ncbi:MAG TPA: MFS transporter [Candidatus Limnocylindrales bacterium]|nr:MFS transporter [Candidatus Limnocylindrales bacterium]